MSAVNPYDRLTQLFEALPLEQKEAVLQEFQEITEKEKKEKAAKSELEDAWDEIQYNIEYLSNEPYIDDQLQIDEIWHICEDLIKSGSLSKERWDLRKKILLDIVRNDFYDEYGASDPMSDLSEAMCTSKEEKLYLADLIWKYGGTYNRKKAVRIYKENGRPEKYFEYLEDNLKDNPEPYRELIAYYWDKDPQKAKAIAEQGDRKCPRARTDFVIDLLDLAAKQGDREAFEKVLTSAKRRPTVDFARIEEHLKKTRQ